MFVFIFIWCNTFSWLTLLRGISDKLRCCSLLKYTTWLFTTLKLTFQNIQNIQNHLLPGAMHGAQRKRAAESRHSSYVDPFRVVLDNLVVCKLIYSAFWKLFSYNLPCSKSPCSKCGKKFYKSYVSLLFLFSFSSLIQSTYRAIGLLLNIDADCTLTAVPAIYTL